VATVVERKAREYSKRNGETTVYNDCDEEQKTFFSLTLSVLVLISVSVAASAQIKLVRAKNLALGRQKIQFELARRLRNRPAAEGLAAS
jgi:hypothetical protein